MKNLRENKGITLIALIVTIVVLLIIAGISINMGITGVDQAGENRLITELEKVQHAVTERYTKYKLTKDTSMLVGTIVDNLPTLPTKENENKTIKWKVLQFSDSTDTEIKNKILQERKYYRLSSSDLSKLGLTGGTDEYKGSSYIVNYYSGEVYDEVQKQTASGTILYKTAIEDEVSGLGDDYIKDGMQVWYDAINNTGSGHSSSTTTWYDLSGNGRDGKMTDVTMGSNYAEFNGTSSWVNMGEMSNFTNQVTLEAMINVPSVAENTIGDIICNQEHGGVCLRYNKGKVFWVIYIKNIGYVQVGCNSSISTNKTYHVIGTYNGLDMKVYINGIEQKDITLYDGNLKPKPNILDNPGTIQGPRYNTVMALGINPIENTVDRYGFYGKIYDARIYNKALSADEIHHNYILDKARYGIEE